MIANRYATEPPTDTVGGRFRMEASVTGVGPRTALIGGGLTGWHSWKPHAESLSSHRQVARLQLLSVQLGLENRALPAGYGVSMESAALAAALDDLGWAEPLDLVAWSYGALITLNFALDHPDRVRTLTLIEPPALWLLDEATRGEVGARELLDFATSLTADVSQADLRRFIRLVALAPPGVDPSELPQWPVWLEHRRSLLNASAPFDHQDDPTRLRSFDRPVLLVTGTGTAPFLRRIHDTLSAWLPLARSIEMPGGHAPHLASMERFLHELEAFHGQPDR